MPRAFGTFFLLFLCSLWAGASAHPALTMLAFTDSMHGDEPGMGQPHQPGALYHLGPPVCHLTGVGWWHPASGLHWFTEVHLPAAAPVMTQLAQTFSGVQDAQARAVPAVLGSQAMLQALVQGLWFLAEAFNGGKPLTLVAHGVDIFEIRHLLAELWPGPPVWPLLWLCRWINTACLSWAIGNLGLLQIRSGDLEDVRNALALPFPRPWTVNAKLLRVFVYLQILYPIGVAANGWPPLPTLLDDTLLNHVEYPQLLCGLPARARWTGTVQEVVPSVAALVPLQP